MTAAQSDKDFTEVKITEEPIAQASRHVVEAQRHVARQEILVARLSGDPRHAELAAEARNILDTLNHTLSLARQHLELELRKRSGI